MTRVTKTGIVTDGVPRISQPRDQRSIRNRNRGNSESANWASASPDCIARAIIAVTATGGAIRFGYTRDQGAFAIGLLGDGEPYTEFVRPTEDVDVYLIGVAEDYERFAAKT